MTKIKYYLSIWLLMCRNSFMGYLYRKTGFLIFLTGKVLRFGVYFMFLFFLLGGTDSLAGYNLNQTLFFFVTFNLIDITSQFLFRQVYSFRPLIVSGDFDLVLVKPVSALFRSLLGGADIIDLVTIPPLLVVLFLVGRSLNPTAISVLLYILLLIFSMIIATSFHIIVIALGIISLEVDHTVMIYRDITNLGRFPVDIYKEPLRGAITFVIPVGIMMTFPAKVFLGLLSPSGVLLSLAFAVALLYTSLYFWKVALRFYTSASS